MILAFDSETTGLPSWNDPSDAPHQPHCIQLAAMLCDPISHDPVTTLSTLIKPGPGAVMEPEAFAAHGISLEQAEREGMDPAVATAKFIEMASQATMAVGHNVTFDFRIMRIMGARHAGGKWRWEGPYFCTMRRSTAIVNLPPTERMRAAGRHGPKAPKLSECIQHFFGEDLDGAHDALVDVQASMRVYSHLTRELGVAA